MNSHEARPRITNWSLLLVLGTIQFVHIVDFVIIMPLGPQFMRVFQLTPKEFGLLVSAYTFIASIFGFLSAFFVDRFDRRKVLLTFFAAFSIATLSCAIAPSYVFLVVARALAGAFGGVLASQVFVIIGDAYPEKVRGEAMGIVMSAFSLAGIIGVPTGLWFANHFTWSAPFLFLFALTAPVFILAARVVPPLNAHLVGYQKESVGQKLKFMFANEKHVLAFAQSALVLMAGFMVIPYISPYLVGNVGATELQLPYFYCCGGVFAFFSSQMIGRLVDRRGMFPMFRTMILLSLLPILTLTHLPPVPLSVMLIVMTFFMMFVSGRMVPTTAIVATAVSAGHRASFMSFNACLQQLAMGIGSFLGGAILGKAATGALTHYNWVGYGSTLVSLTALCISLRLERLSPRPQAPIEAVETTGV